MDTGGEGTDGTQGIDGIVTWATPTSLDSTNGVVATVRRHYPDLPITILASDRLAVSEPSATVVPIQSVVDGIGFAVTECLAPDEQAAVGLPFLLERLIGDGGAMLVVSPGCLLVDQATELAEGLRRRPVALAARSTPTHLHSTTPNLVGLTLGRGELSTRLLALRPGAEDVLHHWQAVMVESFVDVAQRLPSDFTGALFASVAGHAGGTVVGERTVMHWTDYAALESGRADGPRPAVVLADDLWTLGRRQAEGAGDAEVEWQLLADKVHDSRPLEALVEVVKSSVAARPNPSTGDTPFEAFAREVRRASDPTGARWGPGQHEHFLDWLFETDTRGLTRAAELYLAVRPDLCEREPGIRTDPDRFRRWNARHAMTEFGMDLLDRHANPVRPVGRVDRPPSVVGKLRWRAAAAKTFLPGYGTLQARRAEPYPRRRGAPTAPHRRPPGREPRRYASAGGLNLIGCFRSESGLGQAARASLAAVRHLGHDFAAIDTSEEYVSRNAAPAGLDRETFGAHGSVNLLHSNADEMLSLSQRVFRHRLAGRFTAAMWFWEPAQLPRHSLPALDLVDELWVASEYLVDVFGQYGRVPVVNVGLGVDLPRARPVDRAAFGFEDDELVFLFVYDALSSHGRKNPELVIDAFLKAFGPRFDNVRLVLKVSNLNKFPSAKARLETMAAGTPAITLIDRYFERDRVLDLMAAADVYVSLHAAEGFGLTLLEAMALGTPVIATAYSGSMDFTTPANSWLVDYRLMATTAQTGPYPPGSVWAAPDLDAAVALLRLAAADRSQVSVKGERARQDALAATSLPRYAERLDRQLRRVL